MNTESEAPYTTKSFISKVRSPIGIHNNKPKMYTRKAWHEFLRNYFIYNSSTEPHHPHHKPDKSKIQDLNKNVNHIMDHTNNTTLLCL